MRLIDKYGPVLRHYQIQPEYIEEFGKVKKVYSQNRVFALKEIDTNYRDPYRFLQAVEVLYQKGYRQLVPIYKTIDDRELVYEQNRSFYLMPWIEEPKAEYNQRRNVFLDIMTEIAGVHQITSKSDQRDQQRIEGMYSELVNNFDQRRGKMQGFLEECEKKVYMSPFELFYCLHFHQISQIDHQARYKLDDWYEDKQENPSGRMVLCHGRLSPSHYIREDQSKGYLINYENAYMSSPISDLTYFFRRALYMNPEYQQEAVQWFVAYNRYFPLRKDERLYLFYKLLQTDGIQRAIDNYKYNKNQSEYDHVRRLQRNIWLTQSCHYFIMETEGYLEKLESSQNEENPT